MSLVRTVRGLACSSLVALVGCSNPAPLPPERPVPTVSPSTSPSAAEATEATKATKATKPFVLEGGGENYAEDAKLLYRLVTCSGDAPIAPEIASAITEHCKELLPRIEQYKKTWVDVARPFLAGIVPADAPKRVIYPFAGGDNTTVYTTYPDAEEYTSASLELTGDVRRVRDVQPKALKQTLRRLRVRLDELIGDSKFSMSETLQKMMQGELPQELSFLMVGLAIHDLEPVALRYFRLEKDGSIHYYSAAEIAEDKGAARRRKNTWGDGDFPEAFSHVEIAFKPRGKEGPVHFHRHLAWNLDDAHQKEDPGLLAHLTAKGDVGVMIKAASYLLWTEDFSTIRDYILAHAKLVVSDSTAPLPSAVAKAGLVQEVWGHFVASPIRADRKGHEEMIKYWATQPVRPLAFRFGYLDRNNKPHLMVIRRK